MTAADKDVARQSRASAAAPFLPSSALLEGRGLTCFGVGPVDLAVGGGACLALVGPSGSGKSLTLRMVADLVPHQGLCSLAGVPATAMSGPQWRTRVRYLAAEPGWWAPTVRAHFAAPEKLAPALDRLGLHAGLLDAPPEQLSTGERQRMAFLRGIEDAPAVLLLDEPTAALDREATAAVEAMMHERQAAGSALILVSHNEAQVERMADTVVALGRPA